MFEGGQENRSVLIDLLLIKTPSIVSRANSCRSEDATDGFVYAASRNHIPNLGSRVGSLPLELQLFPSLTGTERLLLYYFTHEASRITCCHVNVQKELCHLVVSMGVEVPAFMYATLAWSAIHCVAFNRTVDGVSDLQKIIASFKARSIDCLRTELQALDGNSGEKSDALLATVRTLCQCEIHSGTDVDSAWRVHVKGAKALMTSIKRLNRSRCSISRLLCRWYASLESLAALAFPTNGTRVWESQVLSEVIPESVYLDDYNGYSTDLSLILGKIGTISVSTKPTILQQPNTRLQHEADELEGAVHAIMERDNNQTPIFYTGVAEKLSQQDILQYSLCNQAYQHTALIHIRRRLRGVPSISPIIQQSVKNIIACASSISPAYGLSPAIVLTTPLFTAGCEALGEDREVIRNLLQDLFDVLKIRNIKLAIQILESHWASGLEGDWEQLLSRFCHFFVSIIMLTLFRA